MADSQQVTDGQITLPNDPFAGETIIAHNVPYDVFLRAFDGHPAEWHEGRVIKVMSNNIYHQMVQNLLLVLITLSVGFRPLGRIISAGFSMRVADGLPRREPDLVIVLNEHKDRLKDTYLDGPADIAIEIVSPESVGRDYGAKFQEYELAGVPEYWLIDPFRKNVDVNVLGEGGFYHRLAREDGLLRSTLLPDFVLDPALVWADEPPNGPALIELVQNMLGANG